MKFKNIFLVAAVYFSLVIIACGSGPQIGPGTQVTMHYRMGAENYVYRSTLETGPIVFLFDEAKLLPALKERIAGLKKGQKKRIVLSPQDAFGEKNPELVKRIARSAFPTPNPREGKTFMGEATDGNFYQGLIEKVTDSYVILNLNHPLAGYDVWVEVEIIDVQ